MPKKRYHAISGFWALFVPAVLAGLGYYAYHEPGFLGTAARHTLGPIFEPLIKFFGQLF